MSLHDREYSAFTFTVPDPPVPPPGFTSSPGVHSATSEILVLSPLRRAALQPAVLVPPVDPVIDPQLMDIYSTEPAGLRGQGENQRSIDSSAQADVNTPAQEWIDPVAKRFCVICCNVEASHCVQPCLECKADYCPDCLEDMFRHAITDPTRMPPKCCTMIQLHVGIQYLTKSEARKYRKAFEEWIATDRVYCPVPKCSTFIPDRLRKSSQLNTNPGSFRCPQCSSIICDDCRQIAHQGQACDRSQEQYEEDLLKKFKMKRCPKCRAAVKRMFGCSHMECRCGAHWCWVCQNSITECNGAHHGEYSDAEEEEEEEEDEDEEPDINDDRPPEWDPVTAPLRPENWAHMTFEEQMERFHALEQIQTPLAEYIQLVRIGAQEQMRQQRLRLAQQRQERTIQEQLRQIDEQEELEQRRAQEQLGQRIAQERRRAQLQLQQMGPINRPTAIQLERAVHVPSGFFLPGEGPHMEVPHFASPTAPMMPAAVAVPAPVPAPVPDPVSTAVPRSVTTEQTAPMPTTVFNPVHEDLDGGGDRVWAERDLDLNEEPTEDYRHQVWNCNHKFKRVRIGGDFPLVVNWHTILECNRCFTKLKPYASPVKTTSASGSGSRQANTQTPAPTRSQLRGQESNTRLNAHVSPAFSTMPSARPRSGSLARSASNRAPAEAVYGCVLCNVLYCGTCKAAITGK